jgi:hypothetical protein
MYVIKNDKEMKKSSQRWKDAYNKPMKKGCFSQSCYRTMTVIEVVPQQNKKPQYSMKRHQFLLHHFP